MLILQEVQKSFDSIGFNPKLEPLNHKILGILCIVVPAVLSLWIFLVHEANSAHEYMDSIYVISTSCGIFLSFTSTILITKKLYFLFKVFDEFINEGK